MQKLLKQAPDASIIIETQEQPQQPDDDSDEFVDCQDEEQKQPKASDNEVIKADKPKPLTHIYFALGNKEHHESDLEEKDLTDLDVALEI